MASCLVVKPLIDNGFVECHGQWSSLSVVSKTMKLDAEGSLAFLRDNEFHRTKGPSVLLGDGSFLFHRNGLLCRSSGPAVIKKDLVLWFRKGCCVGGVMVNPWACRDEITIKAPTFED